MRGDTFFALEILFERLALLNVLEHNAVLFALKEDTVFGGKDVSFYGNVSVSTDSIESTLLPEIGRVLRIVGRFKVELLDQTPLTSLL